MISAIQGQNGIEDAHAEPVEDLHCDQQDGVGARSEHQRQRQQRRKQERLAAQRPAARRSIMPPGW
jgi:hypothetical protein